MKFLAAEDVPQFLERLSERGEVFLPVEEEEGIVNFRSEWDRSDPLSGLRRGNTTLPPKDFFFPQTEGVFRFETDGRDLEITPIGADDGGVGEEESARGRVIFGVRPCDLKSLELLDRVFIEGEYAESGYAARREKALIVGWSCLDPEETCFCTAFDTDPGRPEGADLVLTDLGEVLAVEASGRAGEDVLSECGDLLRDGDEAERDRVRELRLEAGQRVGLSPPVDGIPERLEGMFDSDLWDEFSFACLGCGTCAYLCPTCHCYELESESLGREGVRYKCWDSCMFSNFTRMAGGENPRPTKRERLRNRFLHKLDYFVERYGDCGCTGCGRCLKNCPVGVDITEFVDRVQGKGVNTG